MKTCEEYVLSRLADLEKLVKAKNEEIAQLKKEIKDGNSATKAADAQLDQIRKFTSKHFFIRDAGESDDCRYRIVYKSNDGYLETIAWITYDKEEYDEFLELFNPKTLADKKENAD